MIYWFCGLHLHALTHEKTRNLLWKITGNKIYDVEYVNAMLICDVSNLTEKRVREHRVLWRLSECNGHRLKGISCWTTYALKLLTSEWLKEIRTFEMPFSEAFALASPWRRTVGTPDASFKISISFMAAAAPFDLTPRDLKTASLPTQRAANDEGGEGWERQ